MKKRRPKARNRKDTTAGKSYPNGISATVSALAQFWLPTLQGGTGQPTSRPQFMAESNFLERYNFVIDLYPGLGRVPRKPDPVGTMVNDISFGRHRLPYYQLRAFAEFIDLPVGLLLLFAQCASLERDAEDRSSPAWLHIAEGLERVAKSMKERASASRPDEDLFMRHYGTDADSYLPNMEMLKAWRDAYNAKV